ncbi:MAG TPA: M23 family metallopeptidase [Chloroflexota bacterium]|nr:M23 family metallopeptidase [Chloroflexota bacterium]
MGWLKPFGAALAIGVGVMVLAHGVQAVGPTPAAAQQTVETEDFTPAAAQPAVEADAFTPVLVRPVATATAPFAGDDGRFHVAYELWLTNAKAVPATVERIDIIDAENPSRVVRTLAGPDLAAAMTNLDVRPADGTALGPNESRLVFIELTFDDEGEIPAAIAHRFTGTGAANPGAQEPSPLSYVVARWPLDSFRPPVLGAPLRGDGWVAGNGCCSPGPHRSAVQSVNGGLDDGQRFAIDWMKLDADGRLVVGDPSRVENWVGYDQPVLAVADGTVIAVANDYDDQRPGALPDPASFTTLESVDGNHVVLDIGNGFFVFYAHLKKGTVTVSPGERVRAGQELGRLGNSGNTSAPHLHLHVMAGPSPLGSTGLPYVYQDFTRTGAIDPVRFEAVGFDLTGSWGNRGLVTPTEHTNQLPLDLSIVNWPD